MIDNTYRVWPCVQPWDCAQSPSLGRVCRRQMSQSKTLSSILRGHEEVVTCRFAAGDRGRRRRGLWPQLFDVTKDPYSSFWRMAAAEDAALLIDGKLEMTWLTLKTCQWLLQRCAGPDLPMISSWTAVVIIRGQITLIRTDYSIAKPTISYTCGGGQSRRNTSMAILTFSRIGWQTGLSWLFNNLRPSGYYMYHQFNIYKSYVLPPQLYLCVLCGSQNKQRLFPYTASTDWFL